MPVPCKNCLGFLGLVAFWVAWETQTPLEYTLVRVKLDVEEGEEDVSAGRSLHPEVARRLSAPPWRTPAAEVVFLFHGGLEDWSRNPQMILEETLGREVLGFAYGRFADVHGCGRLLGMLSQLLDYLQDWQWSARLEVEVRSPPRGTELDSGATGESSWSVRARKYLKRGLSRCLSQRTFGGAVSETNAAWQHVMLRARVDDNSTEASKAEVGEVVEMTLAFPRPKK